MKKIVIHIGIAVMAFASCAKDIVKEVNNGRAIDFRVAAQTRATETTTANLSTFYVTAIDDEGANFFTDVAFTKIEEYFSSSPAYYWPGDGSELAFYAYAPSATNLGAEVTISNATKTLAGFSPAAEITNQKDFVTATAIGSKANETSGVALTFNHQLTQVEVKARNANEGYIYKVRGVRIAQPVAKADFDFGTSQWTLAADKAVYQVQYGNEITLSTFAQNIMESEDDNAMLIPQQLVAWDPESDKTNESKGAYISVYAQVTTKSGGRVYPKDNGMDYAWLAVPVDTKWEAGYKYVYTLDFTNGAGYSDPIDGPTEEILGNAIKFTVNVIPWNEKDTTDPIVGKWHIKKVHTCRYSKQRDETEEEILDDVTIIEDKIVTEYIEFDWVSPTDFYITDEDSNRMLVTAQIKNGKRYVIDEQYDDGYSKVYFDWEDQTHKTLMMVMLIEDRNYYEQYYLYYEKTN